MSRIGKHPVEVPSGVTVSVEDQTVAVKGKLGELTYETTFGKEYDLKAPGGDVYKVG